MSVEWAQGLEFDIDSNDRLSYTFDWTEWLETGVGIASYTIVASSGVTVDNDAADGLLVSVQVSGVAVNSRESVTCRIVTDESASQQVDRTIYLRGKNL